MESNLRRVTAVSILFAAGLSFVLYQASIAREVSYDKHQELHKMEISNSSEEKVKRKVDPFGKSNFDINGSDVLVFLDMQKTGSSDFGRSLASNLGLCSNIKKNKNKKLCLRPNSKTEWWYFSRFSTGIICGLHPDWTTLHEGIAMKMDEFEGKRKLRRYFYITVLRHPVQRFLSELMHVQRGATWLDVLYNCNGTPNINLLPKCYEGKDWRTATLKEFMSCPYNMGINRQTRMLADLRLVNCYEKWLDKNITSTRLKEIENKMLESAKKNLLELAFFGILEDRRRTQHLFEYVFPMKFKKTLVQQNATRASKLTPTENEVDKIIKLNQLDMNLYEYATELFDKRYESSVRQEF